MRAVLGRWPSLLAAAITIALLLAAGCGEGEDEDAVTPGATPEATAERTPSAEVPGVSDTEIKIGTLLPLSQTAAAAWGVPISKGMQAYYDYINDQGGIYGRKINLIVADNQYSGPVAGEAVRKLVEQEKVFAIQGSLGTAAHSSVWRYLEENGVPDMFILTGNTKWTEPAARNRFGLLVDYITEGRLLGKYVAENFKGKKLGILAQNDDFGKEGEKGLKMGVEENDGDMEFVVEYYDETQNDVTNQIQRLKAANVDVMAFYTMPVQAASGFKVARETLSWDVPVVISGVDAVEVVATLSGYDNIEGAVSVVFGHQAFETDNPGIAKHHEIMAKYAPGVAVDNLTLLGEFIGEYMVHILKQTGPDLTRESFLDAAESMCKFQCSACMVPSSMSPTDHRPIEVEVYLRATVDRSTDPPTFRWEPFGEPFGFESTEDCVTPTPPPGYEEQPE
ncbi:MAG: ABC transporter substrate-binding protein [Dehalococcoidia bacterium]|nr:ABC transporter substrate-binding protein [Dehalococcoidia bacterium]